MVSVLGKWLVIKNQAVYLSKELRMKGPSFRTNEYTVNTVGVRL